MSLSEAKSKADAAADLVAECVAMLGTILEKLQEAQVLRAEVDPDSLSFTLNTAEVDLAVGITEATELQAMLGQGQRNLADWQPS